MELKPGYKQTEVGVIPEDWGVSALGELITEMRGGAPLSPSDFTDGGVKVLPKGGVGRAGVLRVADSDLQYCSTRYANSHRRNQVDETFTIVVLRDLVPSGPSIGLMVRIREPEDYVLAQGVYGFKLNDRAAPGYLVQLSNTTWYRKLANSIMVGSTQVHITNTAFKLARIPVPTKAEQTAIAEALSDADALIESLDQLITKKRHLKQGAMQELLTGKRRLPGFSGEWEAVPIGNIADVKTGPFGSALHESDYVQAGTPIITVEHLGEFGVTRQNLPLVSDEDCKRLSAYSLEAGDIVFSRVGSVDRNALICEDESGWLFSGRLLRVRVEMARVSAPFLSFQFHTQPFKQLVLAVAVGQTMASLNTKILKGILVTLPPLNEQTAIATILSDMDTELAELELRLAKARQIKQGMMQELLTGRIRLL